MSETQHSNTVKKQKKKKTPEHPSNHTVMHLNQLGAGCINHLDKL